MSINTDAVAVNVERSTDTHSLLGLHHGNTDAMYPAVATTEHWISGSPNSDLVRVSGSTAEVRDSIPSSLRQIHLQNHSPDLANTVQKSVITLSSSADMHRPCNDPLCTQYLSKEELAMFRDCTKHLQRSPTNNGTCRFLNGTARHKVALASFPGSGNTWVRGLLEKVTGICTGMYIRSCYQSMQHLSIPILRSK